MKHLACTSIAVLVLAASAVTASAAEMTGKSVPEMTGKPVPEMAGKQVFEHYCSYCHGGADGPGTMQLRRTRGKDQALLAERTNLAPDYIEYVVRHGLRSMPAFVPSDLTEARLKALVAFLTEPLPQRR